MLDEISSRQYDIIWTMQILMIICSKHVKDFSACGPFY